MAALSEQEISSAVSDGTSMDAFVVRPRADANAPGVLVFQEIFGVNDHIRDVTRRLAGEGYLAIAPDLFHRTIRGFKSGYDDMSEGVKHMRAYSEAQQELDARAAWEWLRGQGCERVGAVGFCLGGRVSFVANSMLPLQAAVSFYGSRPSLARAGAQQGPLLLMWGGLDKHFGPSDVHTVTDALRAEKKDFVSVEFAKADHGFFCDQRTAYHPPSAREAWALTQAFFKNYLG